MPFLLLRSLYRNVEVLLNLSYNTVHFVFKGKEAGAGAVDEEDFIKAFEDVPSAQVR